MDAQCHSPVIRCCTGLELAQTLRFRKAALLTVLLTTLLVAELVSAQPALAANSMQNAGFESGNLQPGWYKAFGGSSSIAGISTANNTPNGHYSGYILPFGWYTELRQDAPLLAG